MLESEEASELFVGLLHMTVRLLSHLAVDDLPVVYFH